MCHMEKICVLGKCHTGMSYSAVGYEFHMNELIIDLNVSLSEAYIKYGYVLIS